MEVEAGVGGELPAERSPSVKRYPERIYSFVGPAMFGKDYGIT